MAEQEKWKWQEPGTAWHGIGLYHITLTIPDRKPLLGRLDIPDNNPSRAVVRRTPLGNALVNAMLVMPQYHPEVQVLHFCLMPDHLHFIIYVRHTMPTGIGAVVRESLRNYMNSCVLKARQGVVMVSPFISTQEKMVMQVLLREQRPFIILLDNGFRDFFKPSDALFDACAAGRVLLLSPWPYDATKRHISRADCVALNQMAEEICSM